MSALLLTGGRGHSPEASVGPLCDLLATVDLGVDVHTDVDAGLRALGDHHDLLVINALQFAMADARYDDVRDREGFIVSSDAAAAIRTWHDAGRPILALHTAVISFDSWEPWAEMVGARWDWSRSFHPPVGLSSFVIGTLETEIVDEAYRDLELAVDNDVVAWSIVEGTRQPAAWTRSSPEGGSVAVDLLGHDARSLTHPDHVAMLHALLRWLLGHTPTVQIEPRRDRPRPNAPQRDGLR